MYKIIVEKPIIIKPKPLKNKKTRKSILSPSKYYLSCKDIII